MSTFEDIRSLVHGEPSRRGWEELCAALDDYAGDEDFEEVVLPYCRGGLERWPDELRVAPERWLVEEGRIELRAVVGLCRVVDLEGRRVVSGGIDVLAGSPYLAGVTHLQLGRCGLGDAGVEALADSPYLPDHIRMMGLM